MPVPAAHHETPRPLRRLSILLLALLLAPAVFARGPEPRLSIPLEALGYQPLTKQVLLSGASILTIHYVDDRHLLVTFNLRRLLKRLPGDPPGDLDRNIEAVLVEIPSGKAIARTSWRVHDLNQYLWDLGSGRFLLRIQDNLFVLDPLHNLPAGDVFRQQPLLASTRHIGIIRLSPDARLMTLETSDEAPAEEQRSPSPGTRAFAAAAANPDAGKSDHSHSASPVQINFYRLRNGESNQLLAQAAGAARARNFVLIPADADGFLSVIDQGQRHWAFNFNPYDGKVSELSPFDSTCHPSPHFVSRSEFIAFGCRAGNLPQMLGGFNFRGEEMWEQILPESFISPSFAYAPAAGRFVFSRVLATSPVAEESFAAEQLTNQSITVIQTDSGRQVFHIDSQPILRSTQNFALSPDGLELAVIRNAVIEVYPLPPLTSKDRAGVAKAASLVPPATESPVVFSTPLSTAAASRAAASPARSPSSPLPGQQTYDSAPVSPSVVANSSTVAPAADPDPAIAVPAAAQPAPTASPGDAAQANEGDPALGADAQERRKPPTLYAPDEKPTTERPASPH
jgi:hypothetical protein